MSALRTFLALIALAGLAACQDELDPHTLGRTRCKLAGKRPAPQEQILFGDLHVHSSNSLDALVMNIPILGGSGSITPEVRCDYARFCSRLDFWSINDHPEEQVPDQWRDNIEAMRACNDLTGGYTHTPSMVTFLGWEWTQTSPQPELNWGHKTVVLKDTCEQLIPARPICAPGGYANVADEDIVLFRDIAVGLDPDNQDVYDLVLERSRGPRDVPLCEKGVDVHDLPPDCHEVADDPAELFSKLDQWGLEALVVPHGKTWGAYNPPLSSWSHQLVAGQHNPKYERFLEISSGHGTMEEYRTWRHLEESPGGGLSCPAPTADFEPCCYRAGEIVRARSPACQADPQGAECQGEVDAARQAFVDAGIKGIETISGTSAQDWLDCGQCRDCYQPARSHRPEFTAQAALAMSGLDDPAHPVRYALGFVGSTDSHVAGPGAGYKEYRKMSDNIGAAREEYDAMVAMAGNLVIRDFERQNSFYFSGSLVAVHAAGRSRQDIWDALQQRRVYATAGERTLLWFHLTNGPDGQRLPMGSVASLAQNPSFEIRAQGSFKQSPGCPAEAVAGAPAGFIDAHCQGECYNPTGERHLITRMDVVKITPQASPGEPLEDLIRDPYRSFTCDPDPQGCTATFDDPDFLSAGRPAGYYVRVYQEPTPVFNAETLRCTFDADGNCTQTSPCPGGYHGDLDDCLAPDQEAAWSSPIYLTPAD